MKPATRCLQIDRDDPFGSISPPIYQSSTFRQPTATEFGQYDYTRSGNPTRSQLEKKIAQLENGKYCSAFTSGMAAITALMRLLKSGDEIIASNDLYGGSVRLLERVVPRQGIGVKYVDTTDLTQVILAFTERTRLLLVETPTNPFLRISDIWELSRTARARSALLAVDNTVLSPYLQMPLEHGADIVIHSATKFLCGHSDVMAGAVVTNDKEIHSSIAFTQNAEGAGLSPFDSWLLLRGMKTLALRVERQSSNAETIGRYLAERDHIKRVYYPGIGLDERDGIHSRQAAGGGSVVSFTTGDAALSKAIVESTQLCSIAVSFGSVHSTISMPCYMSHASIPDSLRDQLAPPPDLIRLSAGIEDVDDIIEDLEIAISSALRSMENDLSVAQSN